MSSCKFFWLTPVGVMMLRADRQTEVDSLLLTLLLLLIHRSTRGVGAVAAAVINTETACMSRCCRV